MVVKPEDLEKITSDKEKAMLDTLKEIIDTELIKNPFNKVHVVSIGNIYVPPRVRKIIKEMYEGNDDGKKGWSSVEFKDDQRDGAWIEITDKSKEDEQYDWRERA